LDEVVAGTMDGGVGVGACGPSGMVDGVERLVGCVSKGETKRVGGVEIHAERFSL
jgi:ferric-chelate reductase